MTIIVHFTIEHQVYYDWKFKEQDAKIWENIAEAKSYSRPRGFNIEGPSAPVARSIPTPLDLVMQRYIVQTIYRVDIGHIVASLFGSSVRRWRCAEKKRRDRLTDVRTCCTRTAPRSRGSPCAACTSHGHGTRCDSVDTRRTRVGQAAATPLVGDHRRRRGFAVLP